MTAESIEPIRVLLVDDDPSLLRGYKNALTQRGFSVDTAQDGREAAERLEAGGHFDIILSDINMPGHSGLQFLRSVRERDLDVPVALMTGTPSIQSSLRALEYGAFRYLLKPVAPDELAAVIRLGARLHKMAQLKRRALEIAGVDGKWLGDRATLENSFAHALDQMWMAFQPIVSWGERRVFGYEALLRSNEKSLADPWHFVEAADRLGRLNDLGRLIRDKIAEAAADAPPDVLLFVNAHSSDLNDEHLHGEASPLTSIASRVVIEVTERASLDGVKDPSGQVKRLRAQGFRIAVDDLGAGYAGLTSFAQLEPEVVKLDMSLVRGLDTQPRKQSIVRSMKALCGELGMRMVAEGVETVAERDALVKLGCDLFQGYLFARPERGFVVPRW